jgi:hypothetical protein
VLQNIALCNLCVNSRKPTFGAIVANGFIVIATALGSSLFYSAAADCRFVEAKHRRPKELTPATRTSAVGWRVTNPSGSLQ